MPTIMNSRKEEYDDNGGDNDGHDDNDDNDYAEDDHDDVDTDDGEDDEEDEMVLIRTGEDDADCIRDAGGDGYDNERQADPQNLESSFTRTAMHICSYVCIYTHIICLYVCIYIYVK